MSELEQEVQMFNKIKLLVVAMALGAPLMLAQAAEAGFRFP